MKNLVAVIATCVVFAGVPPSAAFNILHRSGTKNASVSVTPLPTSAKATLRRVQREVRSLKVPVPANTNETSPLKSPTLSGCSFLGGLASAEISAQCCTSIQVVTQRQLRQYGMASRCKPEWQCEADGATPLPVFEARSLSSLCGEPGCLPTVVASIKTNPLTEDGAEDIGNICSTLASLGGNNANPEEISKLLSGSYGRSGKGRKGNGNKEGEEGSKKKKGNKPACFPGEAIVHVRGEGEVPLGKVKTGDKVLVDSHGQMRYEPILAFLHAIPGDPLHSLPFVHVSHENGKFRASAAHIVFVALDDEGTSWTSKLVGNLRVGDKIFAAVDRADEWSSKPSSVHDIRRSTTQSGMFAPLTSSGTIVVDGVVASNYASASEKKHLPHTLAHAFLFPVRLYHQLGLASTWRGQNVADEELHPYLKVMWQYLRLDSFLPSQR